MPDIPLLTLNDGNTLPQMGFGVFRVPDAEATAVVESALQAGFRAIDTAAYYGNEPGTGAAIAASSVPRPDIHVTTKVWHTDLGYDATLRAVKASLDRLRLDYLDLCLIHWPVPARDLYAESWRALEQARADGLIRSIGVSNFLQPQLQRLIDESGTVPAVNQIELHPRLPQESLRAFHTGHGIVTQAWSPLAHGQLIADPIVAAVARRHGRSPAQVLLRWNTGLGTAVVTKSVTPHRIAENLGALDFALDADDERQLAALDTGDRTGPDPATFGS